MSWNIRGIRMNIPEVRQLMIEKNPLVFCLQETKLPAGREDFELRGFQAHHLIHSDGQIACGGVSIFVKNGIPHRKIPLNTNIQAIAVRSTLYRPITICSVYIPPDKTVVSNDLENLLRQLPVPYIVTGDFNAHSPLWGNSSLDEKGEQVETFLANTDAYLANGLEATRINVHNLNTSAIDLTFCDPILAPELSWSVLEDDHGSDHFPVCIEMTPPGKQPCEPRWSLKRADWEMFSQRCLQEITDLDSYDTFINKLTDICDSAIPKTSGRPRKNNSWFNQECRVAAVDKKRAYRKARRTPTVENVIAYRIARARLRTIIRENKRRSFHEFVSSMNSQTPLTSVWKMIKRLKGTGAVSSVHHVSRPDGSLAETEGDIANVIAERLSQNSSSSNYNANFLRAKQRAETTDIHFQSDNTEYYNKALTMDELRACLSESNNSAPGPDKINYEILRRLPSESLAVLLNIFNDIWTTQTFPDSWRLATIVPIPKPGKDHSDASNYRPISLTSCLCKLMEKIINKRLMWYLEQSKSLSPLQCGFRKNRSTIDHLVRLESFIREVFERGEHLVAIFFDLEKAFDTTWKFGILKDLHNLGLRGNLPKFIKNFLDNRSFQVKVGSSLSDIFNQAEGVPQGSILSPILFEIKINSITETLGPSVNCSLYVDDFLVCYKSRGDTGTIERQLQLQLDKLSVWADQNGFKFSPSKTMAVHFCNRRECQDPELEINNNPIQVKDQARFLGVIFDRKLNFLPHINDLKVRCQKALRVMKVLASREWGADSTTLLHIYRTLVRSKLDYASFVYGSARKTYVKKLDPIHHGGVRLALGAFSTSPTVSLLAEADEPPLKWRRKKLALQYITKIKAVKDNPAHKNIHKIDRITKLHFQTHPKKIPPLGIRIAKDLEDMNINLEDIQPLTTPKTPPWVLLRPNINLELSKLEKSQTDPQTYIQTFHMLSDTFTDHTHIYTDGSKDDEAVGCAFYSTEGTESQRLNGNASIFTAEAAALKLAVAAAEESDGQKFLILSDSLSCLKALSNYYNTDPRITSIADGVDRVLKKGKEVTFLWIPSHIGIQGNERADQLAKEALRLDLPRRVQLPHVDLKPKIRSYVNSLWKDEWSQETDNKLKEVKPELHPRRRCCNSRREDVKMTRLRIGHSALTHRHLLAGEAAPRCSECNDVLTVRHVLIECPEMDRVRKTFYPYTNMKDLFDKADHKTILSFVSEYRFLDSV